MLRHLAILGLLASSATAERRKNSLPGNIATNGFPRPPPLTHAGQILLGLGATPESDTHEGRLLLGLGASVGGGTNTDATLRFFVRDRITIGGRLRFDAGEAHVGELELGYSLASDVGQTVGTWFRTDVVAQSGAGARDRDALGFVGLAIRSHAREQSPLYGAFAFELGARASTTTRDRFVGELTLGALVMWPPVGSTWK